jgi:hypothetical protein
MNILGNERTVKTMIKYLTKDYCKEEINRFESVKMNFFNHSFMKDHSIYNLHYP